MFIKDEALLWLVWKVRLGYIFYLDHVGIAGFVGSAHAGWG